MNKNHASYAVVTAIACLISWYMGRASIQRINDATSVESETPPIQYSHRSTSVEPELPNIPPRSEVTNDWVAMKAHLEERSRQRARESVFRPFTERESVAYIPMFMELGLSEDQARERMAVLEDIHVASNDANMALIEFAKARLKYDSEMREMLSPESYAAYRQFESEKPARIEMEGLNRFLAPSGEVLGAQEPIVLQAIAEANAYRSQPSYGAYGPYPSPAMDPELVVAMQNREADALLAGSERLHGLLQDRVSAEVLESIMRYYQSRIDQLEGSMRAWQSSDRSQELLRVNDTYNRIFNP
jgi:hypothetical protein